jgi:hypothetical protein
MIQNIPEGPDPLRWRDVGIRHEGGKIAPPCDVWVVDKETTQEHRRVHKRPKPVRALLGIGRDPSQLGSCNICNLLHHRRREPPGTHGGGPREKVGALPKRSDG